jgi:hypothetical protein
MGTTQWLGTLSSAWGIHHGDMMGMSTQEMSRVRALLQKVLVARRKSFGVWCGLVTGSAKYLRVCPKYLIADYLAKGR